MTSRDIHMDTAKGFNNVSGLTSTRTGVALMNDIHMDTVKAGTTIKQGGFQLWERELLESPEVKRKATVAQLC